MTRAEAIARLDATVAQVAGELPALPSPTVPHAGWGAHEVLSHIVFWHETYARVLEPLSRGRDPILLDGVFREFNRIAVARLRNVPDVALAARLRRANVIVAAALAALPPGARIRIRTGAKPRGPREFADGVDAHLRGHLAELRHLSCARRAS